LADHAIRLLRARSLIFPIETFVLDGITKNTLGLEATASEPGVNDVAIRRRSGLASYVVRLSIFFFK